MGMIDTLLQRVLAHSLVYDAFQNAVGVQKQRRTIVNQYLSPQRGDRVLDIGCGTADILIHLIDSGITYDGVDYNPHYIDYARKQWDAHPSFRFHLLTIDQGLINNPLLAPGSMDAVMAIGVLHHLDDAAAAGLVAGAHHVLKQGGRLVTMDPCRFDGMSLFDRLVVDNDRGKFIRNEAGFRRLFEARFSPDRVVTELRRNIVRVPGKSLYAICTR